MKPIEKFRSGLVQASVFQRMVENQDGGEFESQSVSLQISYKKDEEWINNRITVVRKNIMSVIDVLQQVENYLNEALEVSASFDILEDIARKKVTEEVAFGSNEDV